MSRAALPWWNLQLNLSNSEIIAAQEDLRGWSYFTNSTRCNCVDPDTAMLAKAKGVQADVDKLVSGNETLQMYIDNLTMQMAKRR